MDDDIKALIEILKHEGRGDLAELLIESSSNVDMSGSYGNYMYSVLSKFEIFSPYKRYKKLRALNDNDKEFILKCLLEIYPHKEREPEIVDIIFYLSKEHTVKEHSAGEIVEVDRFIIAFREYVNTLINMEYFVGVGWVDIDGDPYFDTSELHSDMTIELGIESFEDLNSVGVLFDLIEFYYGVLKKEYKDGEKSPRYKYTVKVNKLLKKFNLKDIISEGKMSRNDKELLQCSLKKSKVINNPKISKCYDLFICHASEDKETIVKELTSELEKHGIKFWIDALNIKWGDGIVSYINDGLGKSNYVLAIISKAFVDKNWPEKELNAALHLEISSGKTKVLPLLVGDIDIKAKYPLLAEKYYKKWEDGLEIIINALLIRLAKEED
ncbi:toll/interleukin-1 receptor domain-containing protein [bacterium]|nr:toll/interleukin-1 receptor domain-containing protein [bacterium]